MLNVYDINLKTGARNCCEYRIIYLVKVSANDCTQNGGRLHDKDEVPVNQGLTLEGVAATDVEKQVGHSTTNYGEVGKSNGILCWKTCKESRRLASGRFCSTTSLLASILNVIVTAEGLFR